MKSERAEKIASFCLKAFLGLALIGIYVLAYNRYQVANETKLVRAKVDDEVARESRKTSNLIDHNSNEIIYLAPKGAKSKVDVNADVIDQLVKKTFKYSSPQAFYSQAQFIKDRVEGPFYKYWFGKSIKDSYEGLKLEANGSSIKRSYSNYTLVKKGNLHYFAVLSTHTKLGYDTKTTPHDKTFALDFVWNNKTRRWHVSALPDVNMQ